MIDDDIRVHIPRGEQNAIPASAIWKATGLWALTSVKNKLNIAAKNGQIERKMCGGQYIYWTAP